MITVLIAEGVNQLYIPCRLFKSMEEGEVFCDELFNTENKKTYADGMIRYSVDIESMDKVDDESELTEDSPSSILFTSSYYGCGSPGYFQLKEIPFNEKFVPFDLD